jgi:hypothetical protein
MRWSETFRRSTRRGRDGTLIAVRDSRGGTMTGASDSERQVARERDRP